MLPQLIKLISLKVPQIFTSPSPLLPLSTSKGPLVCVLNMFPSALLSYGRAGFDQCNTSVQRAQGAWRLLASISKIKALMEENKQMCRMPS